MKKHFLSPGEITRSYLEIGLQKGTTGSGCLFLLGLLGGAFIAFASEGSNAAIHTMESVGLGKALAGALFSTGLMLVLLAGAELFTGNHLMVISWLEKKISFSNLLRNWFWVYLGNFIGSILLAFFILQSGQLQFSSGLLGGFTIKTAVYKTNLAFGSAFYMGILCNWLVCLAVWMSSGAQDIAGKILAIFFPIWLFITSGFEHCVANMYYISAGLFAKENGAWVAAAVKMGTDPAQISNLTVQSFLLKNLLPVTLGNLVGGVLFVGMMYWLIYLKQTDAK